MGQDSLYATQGSWNPSSQYGKDQDPYGLFDKQGTGQYYAGLGGSQDRGEEIAVQYGNNERAAPDRSGVLMNTRAANYDAGQQQQAIGLLRGAALGQAPSAAEIQSRQANDEAIQNQMAAAMAARGGPQAQIAAQRQASMQGASMAQQGINQAAMIRAQEMAQAREGYGQLTGQSRQMSLQQAAQQAQLEDAQRARNDQLMMGYAGLSSQTRQANANEYLAQRQLEQQQNQYNSNRVDQYVSAAATAAAAGAMAMSDISAKQDISPSDPMAISMPSAPSADEVQSANQVLAQQDAQKSAAQAAMNRQLMGGLNSATAHIGHNETLQVPNLAPSLYSDENMKMRPNGGHTLDHMLNAFKESAATYAYKDPSNNPTAMPKPAGSRFAGIMAQRVEQVPEIGHSLVSNTAKGKMIEGPAMVSALAAGEGRLKAHSEALEARLSRLEAQRAVR